MEMQPVWHVPLQHFRTCVRRASSDLFGCTLYRVNIGSTVRFRDRTARSNAKWINRLRFLPEVISAEARATPNGFTLDLVNFERTITL
jgi:hypothetical protein